MCRSQTVCQRRNITGFSHISLKGVMTICDLTYMGTARTAVGNCGDKIGKRKPIGRAFQLFHWEVGDESQKRICLEDKMVYLLLPWLG